MSCTDPRPRTLVDAEAIVAGFLAKRRALHGNLRMEADPPADPPQDPPADPPADPAHQPPTDPADPNYFPPNTPVAEMTDKQAAAYWRNQSKIQQARVPKDVDQLAADAQRWREHQQAQQTPAEQAVAEAEQRGRAAATREANERAATTIIRASLEGRGKSAEDVTAILRGVNAGGFISNDEVDTAAIAAFVDRIAPAQDQQQGGGGRDIGQGRGRGSTGGTSVNAGRERYHQRHTRKSA